MDASSPRSLVIRRTSPQGDRRRRVVIDPSSSDDHRIDPKSAGPLKSCPPRRYAAGALPDQQLRWCDVIPLSAWKLAGLWTVTLAWIAVLIGLDHASHLLEQAYAGLDLASFHLEERHSLSHATQSMMLWASLLLCGGITHLRRYRIDDYRGHYRIGYYVTALAFAVSLEASTGIVSSLGQLQVMLGSQMPWFPASVGIAIGEWCVFVGVIGRVAWEVRRSPATLVAIVAAAICSLSWRISPLLPLAWSPELVPICQQMASGWTFIACVTYARYIILDAQELLAPAREELIKIAVPQGEEPMPPLRAGHLRWEWPRMFRRAKSVSSATNQTAQEPAGQGSLGVPPTSRETHGDERPSNQSTSRRVEKATTRTSAAPKESVPSHESGKTPRTKPGSPPWTPGKRAA